MRLNQRQEDGFTLVEVIVAAVVMVLVIAAAAIAFTSASRTQSQAKIGSRGREVATTVLRKLQGDTSWIATCEAAVPVGTFPPVCTIPVASVVSAHDRLLQEGDGTVTHTVTIRATPLDLPGDEIGDADRDRRPVDIWRLSVVNRVTGPAMSDAGARYTADGTVNPAVRGTTGVVRLRMCAADRQIDERLGLGLCSNETTGAAATRTLDIAAPPGASCTGATANLVCNPWNAAELADNSLSERYTSVRVRPMPGATVTLVGPLSGNSASRTITMAANGAADVQGLRPGQYRVTVASPLAWGGGSWATWSSHSVPSGGHLIVEKGGLREATLLMRPRMPEVRLNVETLNRTDPFNPVVEPAARFTQTVRLMPIPTGRTNLERGTGQNGWTTIRQGDRSVVLRESSAGLYSIFLLHYPRNDVSRLRGAQQFVWIDPDGSTSPTPLTVRQDFCDKNVRNAIVRARCGTERWCWVGSTFVGQCNDNPTPTGSAASGTGGA